jgi:hypothetical protein
VNHRDRSPRPRDSLADANPPDDETARLAYLQRGAGSHFQAGGLSGLKISITRFYKTLKASDFVLVLDRTGETALPARCGLRYLSPSPHLMQADELAQLVRPEHMWPRIDGTP